jgi:hypothetical protein
VVTVEAVAWSVEKREYEGLSVEAAPDAVVVNSSVALGLFCAVRIEDEGAKVIGPPKARDEGEERQPYR